MGYRYRISLCPNPKGDGSNRYCLVKIDSSTGFYERLENHTFSRETYLKQGWGIAETFAKYTEQDWELLRLTEIMNGD